MARGPWTPKWLEQRIVEIWEASSRRSVAKEVRHVIKTQLGEENQAHLTPSLRKVQVVLTEARKRPPPDKDIDRPWSIGVSDRVGIPSEVIGYLLRIWNRCIVAGIPFTIRQAQWADRIRTALPDGEPEAVAFEAQQWAHRYAIRERAAEALGREMDTSDLDGFLAFAGSGKASWRWEYVSAVQAGAVPNWGPGMLLEDIQSLDPSASRKELLRIFREQNDLPTPGAFVEFSLGLALTTASTRVIYASAGQPVAEAQVRIGGRMQTILHPGKPFDETQKEKILAADRVYALWLRRVSKTTRWNAISQLKRQETAKELGNTLLACAEEAEASTSVVDSTREEPAVTTLCKILKTFHIEFAHPTHAEAT